MTDRERWIVYPLIFLALGAVLKDKLLPATVVRADTIQCNKLRCGKALADVLTTQQLTVADPQQQPRIILHVVREQAATGGKDKQFAGRLDLFGGNDRNQVVLGGSENGGFLIAMSRARGDAAADVVIGHHALGSGLFWLDGNGHITKVLAARPGRRAKEQRSEEKPSEGP